MNNSTQQTQDNQQSSDDDYNSDLDYQDNVNDFNEMQYQEKQNENSEFQSSSDNDDQDLEQMEYEQMLFKIRKRQDLFKHIPAPNEIMEKEETQKYTVNTAFNWRYEKLQPNMWQQVVPENEEGELKIIRGDLDQVENNNNQDKQMERKKKLELEKKAIEKKIQREINIKNGNAHLNDILDKEQQEIDEFLNTNDKLQGYESYNFKNESQDQENVQQGPKIPWQQYFENKKLVFKKYDDYVLNDNKYMATMLCDLKPLVSDVVKRNQTQITSQYFGIQKYQQQQQKSQQHNQSQQSQKSDNNLNNMNQNFVYSKFQEKEKNHILEFSSDFESGNLFQAYKTGPFEYDLVLQNDINTKGNTQWFFFSVKNAKKMTPYRFNIVNLVRKNSLYSQGLKPLVYSEKDFELHKQWYVRDTYHVEYKKNNIEREFTSHSDNKSSSYYTLSFTYKFHNEDDRVFFSYSYPYTYTKLNEYLDDLEKDEEKSKFINRRLVCQTLAKNNVEQINITENSNKRLDKRKGVVLMARQHPGEVNGSWMIEGAIDYLLEDTFEARFLREQCIFKIIPMINVDGVIHGNNRCSLSGQDLNRRWGVSNPKLHPETYHTYHKIRQFNNQRNMELLVDFHGHSKKLNSFFYGNSYSKKTDQPRLFPLIMSKHNKPIKFENCRFKTNKSFDNTARQALQKLLKIKTIYTLEASQYGYLNSIDKIIEFTPQKYKNLGRGVCETLFMNMFQNHCNQLSIKPLLPQIPKNAKKKDDKKDFIDEFNRKYDKKLQKAQNLKLKYEQNGHKISDINQIEILKKQIKKQNKEEKEIEQKSDYESEDFSGSDSEPSQDGLDKETMNKIIQKSFAISKKKKKIKQMKKDLLNDNIKKNLFPDTNQNPPNVNLVSRKRTKTEDIAAQRKEKLQNQNNENKNNLIIKKGKNIIVASQQFEQQQLKDILNNKKNQFEEEDSDQENYLLNIKNNYQKPEMQEICVQTEDLQEQDFLRFDIRDTNKNSQNNSLNQSLTPNSSKNSIEQIQEKYINKIKRQFCVQGVQYKDPLEQYGMVVNGGIQREIACQTDITDAKNLKCENLLDFLNKPNKNRVRGSSLQNNKLSHYQNLLKKENQQQQQQFQQMQQNNENNSNKDILNLNINNGNNNNNELVKSNNIGKPPQYIIGKTKPQKRGSFIFQNPQNTGQSQNQNQNLQQLQIQNQQQKQVVNLVNRKRGKTMHTKLNSHQQQNDSNINIQEHQNTMQKQQQQGNQIFSSFSTIQEEQAQKEKQALKDIQKLIKETKINRTNNVSKTPDLRVQKPNLGGLANINNILNKNSNKNGSYLPSMVQNHIKKEVDQSMNNNNFSNNNNINNNMNIAQIGKSHNSGIQNRNNLLSRERKNNNNRMSSHDQLKELNSNNNSNNYKVFQKRYPFENNENSFKNYNQNKDKNNVNNKIPLGNLNNNINISNNNSKSQQYGKQFQSKIKSNQQNIHSEFSDAENFMPQQQNKHKHHLGLNPQIKIKQANKNQQLGSSQSFYNKQKNGNKQLEQKQQQGLLIQGPNNVNILVSSSNNNNIDNKRYDY